MNIVEEIKDLGFLFWFLVVCAVGCVAIGVWFFATHTCVRSHSSTCYQTACFGTDHQICTTSPYTCEVCDEFGPR